MIAYEIAEISLANHYQPRTMRQVGMIGGKCMFQTVFAGQKRKRHHSSRQSVGECHTGTGFLIGTVFHGTRQEFGNVADSFACIHVAGKVGSGGDESFNAMEQRIEALKCGISRRHGKHQFRINNGKDRKERRVHYERLFVRILFGNDTAAVRFRTCSGRGRNGNNGQRTVLYRLSFAGADSHIIPQIAIVGCQKRDSF